jgi:hypothetical protein
MIFVYPPFHPKKRSKIAKNKRPTTNKSYYNVGNIVY